MHPRVLSTYSHTATRTHRVFCVLTKGILLSQALDPTIVKMLTCGDLLVEQLQVLYIRTR